MRNPPLDPMQLSMKKKKKKKKKTEYGRSASAQLAKEGPWKALLAGNVNPG